MRLAGIHGEVLAQGRSGGCRQRVVKVRIDGRDRIVKLFGHRRGRIRTLVRNLGHRWIVAKTPTTPEGRRDTERRLLRLWRSHDFPVPEVLDLEVSLDAPQPYLVLEFIPGPRLCECWRDPEPNLEGLVPKLQQFAAECARRHDLALRLEEPRLIHTHPNFRHLIDRGDQLVYIDFEHAYLSAAEIPRYISMELAGFIESIEESSNPQLVDTFVSAYLRPERLERMARDLRVGRGAPVWVGRLARHLPLRSRRGLTVRDAQPV